MDRFFQTEFWQHFFESTIAWVVDVVPALLLIAVITIVSLRMITLLVKRLHKLMLAHLHRNRNLDIAEEEKRVDTLTEIINSALKVALWAIVAMLILKQMGIDIGPIIAGAGIVGLAVGFGAQELVRDFISGFFMLLENQVRAGDVAIVNGTGGLVEHVGLRTIVLRDVAGVVHVYQNGKVDTLSNMTKEWSAMIFDIGIAYKEDTDKVMDVMRRVDEDLRKDEEFSELILEPLEIYGVDAFAASSVVIKARLKTKPIKQWSVGREFRRRLKKAFDEENIEIPFPHQTIYWGAEAGPLKIESESRAKADE